MIQNNIGFMVEMTTSAIHTKLWNSEKQMILSRGGSSSTKTYSKCQLLANWLVTGQLRKNQSIPKGIASVVRKQSTRVNKSVLRDFKNILAGTRLLDMAGRPTGKVIADVVKENKTEKFFTFGDRIVEFFGADDEQKVRGPRRNILYCNEVNELVFKEEFNQLNIRTSDLTMFDYNPDDIDSWMNVEIEQKRAVNKGDVDIIVSTFWDNPFLSDRIVDEIKNLKEVDPELWKIYGKGEYGRIQGLIFPNIKEVDSIPEGAKFWGYGGDYGYSNDPTAVIAVYEYENEWYFDEILYEIGFLNTDTYNELMRLGCSPQDLYYFDSAEPKSNQELYNMGLNMQEVEKGQDSINFGIKLIKQKPINITKRSFNLKREFTHYVWRKDMTGEPTRKPIDNFNHGIDGIRYCVMNYKDIYVGVEML